MLGFAFLNFDHVPRIGVLRNHVGCWLPDAPVGNVAQMWGITLGYVDQVFRAALANGGGDVAFLWRSGASEFLGLCQIRIRSLLIPLGLLGLATVGVGDGEFWVEFDGFRVVSDGTIKIALGPLGPATVDVVQQHLSLLARDNTRIG